MGDMNNDNSNNNDNNNKDGYDTTQSPTNTYETQQSDLTQDTDVNHDMDMKQDIDPNMGLNMTIEPEKKKPQGKLIVLLVAIAVLLVGSITAYANRNALASTFAMMTKSPTEYYAYVEQKGINSSIDTLTNYYDASLKQYTNGVAQDSNLKVTINPEFGALLGLGNVKSVEAKLTSLSKNGNAKSNIGILYNDTSLLTMDTFMNTSLNELYLKIPELSNAYLLFAFEELMTQANATVTVFDSSNYIENVQALINEEALSADNINTILKKYTSIITKNIDHVTLEKDIELSASEISSNYSKLIAEIDEEDLYNMGMAILNEAKNDEAIMNICILLDLCTKEEYAKLVDDAILELNTNKESMIASEDSIIMSVYVDNSGKIMGREFISTDDVATSLGYYITRKGTDFGLNAWVTEDDINIAQVTGNATYANHSFTGKANISVSEYNDTYGDYTTYAFDLAFEDVSHSDKKEQFNGKYTITSDLLAGMELILDCTSEQDQQKIVIDLLYSAMKTATIEINSKELPYEDFEFPSATEEVIDGTNDINSYLETADFDSFITKLEDTLEIENLASYVESILSTYMQ